MVDPMFRRLALDELRSKRSPIRSRRQVKKLLGRSYVHPEWPNVEAFIAPGTYRSQAVSMLEVVASGVERYMPRRQAREAHEGAFTRRAVQ